MLGALCIILLISALRDASAQADVHLQVAQCAAHGLAGVLAGIQGFKEIPPGTEIDFQTQMYCFSKKREIKYMVERYENVVGCPTAVRINQTNIDLIGLQFDVVVTVFAADGSKKEFKFPALFTGAHLIYDLQGRLKTFEPIRNVNAIRQVMATATPDLGKILRLSGQDPPPITFLMGYFQNLAACQGTG